MRWFQLYNLELCVMFDAFQQTSQSHSISRSFGHPKKNCSPSGADLQTKRMDHALFFRNLAKSLNQLHLVPIHYQLHSLHDVLGHSLRCRTTWRWAALAAARGLGGRHIADAGVDPFHGQSQVQHTWQPLIQRSGRSVSPSPFPIAG